MSVRFMQLICVFIGLFQLSACNRKLSDPLENRDPFQSVFIGKTEGRPVPLPQVYTTTNIQNLLNPRKFLFKYEKDSVVCDLISLAFDRYAKLMFEPQRYQDRVLVRKLKANKLAAGKRVGTAGGVLTDLVVKVVQPCEDYPQLESDETYTLEITEAFATVISNTTWGTLRALETFSQLVYENDFGEYFVNNTYIHDYPRFQHRGVLLDTSRHFISTSILKTHIEAMAANKMNVFHWHIVDDQSFPYQSYSFPELSQKGAFDPYTHVYSSSDVKEIIEFSRQRGIRVVSEFDSPGHTLSWGKALPILTPCYTDSKPDGTFGPMDPSNNATYAFLRTFIKELVDVFPDKYLHLGGDEVDFSCWKSNPSIGKFMQDMGFGGDYSKLEQLYIQNLLDIVKEVSPSTGYIIWQEVVDNNVKVGK